MRSCGALCCTLTSLYGANLEGGYLSDADLNGATYDAETRWPVGFLPPASC